MDNSTLKLRDSDYILRDKNGQEYTFVRSASRTFSRLKLDSLGIEIIEGLAKCQDTEENLIRRLSANYSSRNILGCIDSLKREGVIVQSNKTDRPERYTRQLSFFDDLTDSPEESEEMQRKIEESKIAVFGVGGIGSWIVNGLGQIGVGEIRIIDPDIVSISNLNRQIGYNKRDMGRYKVEALVSNFPDFNLIPFRNRVSEIEDLSDIIEGCTFLVNCADQPSIVDTTKIIDGYARKREIPYSIAGGYNMHLGMIGPIIIPGKSACFDCFLAYQKENDPLKDLAKVKEVSSTGNFGPIAGAIGNLHVMDIAKFLLGKGSINIERFAEIDFLDLSVEWREFTKQINCPNCK